MTHHALPEVHWSSHFGQEFREDHSSTVCKDHVHDTVHLHKVLA